VSNFCIDIESGRAFVYEVTLESQYLMGRFGAVPNIDVKQQAQFIHHPINIESPVKLAKELRKLADHFDELYVCDCGEKKEVTHESPTT
jgi:hypothetical protein